MMRGVKSMKCLKIENGQGFFRKTDGNMIPIDQIGKEDILCLLDVATNTEQDFEMDDPEECKISNTAHDIIYKSLFSKFQEVLEKRTQFLEESNALYKDALKKYQVE